MIEKREIKTLLLGKIMARSSNNETVYKKVYLKAHSNGKRYFTLGGFDTLSVYDTVKPEGSEWLEDVLQDKKEIIQHVSENGVISYHPIHLIRHSISGFSDRETGSILLLTFLYGVNEACFSSKDGKFTLSDDIESDFYQCINISDGVLLTYTNDIPVALKAIFQLEIDNKVRKTYTTVNLLLNDNGKIGDYGGDGGDGADDQNEWETLSLSVTGTIQNSTEWQKVMTELRKLKPENYQVNFGENDFSFKISLSNLKCLISVCNTFQDLRENISAACWDFQSELQWAHVDDHQEESKDTDQKANSQLTIGDTLNKEVARFGKLFNKIDRAATWKHPYMELLTANLNIERSPILRGPACLVLDCVRILNDYIETAYDDKCSIKDVSDLDHLLETNSEDLERFVRYLSNLTVQLTRNDDIVFRGLGRLPSIAMTLPENLLEYYQALLCELTNAIITVDSGISDNYDCFAYMIAPVLQKPFSIRQIPQIELEFRNETGQTSPRWPNKTAYLVVMPIDDVFSPKRCFISLTHECFHNFGDVLRNRDERLICSNAFLSAQLLYLLSIQDEIDSEIDSEDPNDLSKKVYGSFMKCIGEILISKPTSPFYLDALYADAWIKSKFLLSSDGYEELRIRLSSEKCPEAVRVLERKNVIREWNSEAVVQDCRASLGLWKHLFRECYADYMTIKILLYYNNTNHIEDYFDAIEPELRNRNKDDPDRADVVYRVSIVLSALNRDGLDLDGMNNGRFSQHEDLWQEIVALTKFVNMDDNQDKCIFQPRRSYEKWVTTESLRNVRDYLKSCGEKLKDHLTDNSQRYFSNAIAHVRENYEKCIRAEDMFNCPVLLKDYRTKVGGKSRSIKY